MFLCETHKLIGDATEWIELKGMFAWARLEKLVSALFKVDRGSACHVEEVIVLAIPGKRRSHAWTIARVVKEIRAGEVLGVGKGCRGVAEVWRVIVKE